LPEVLGLNHWLSADDITPWQQMLLPRIVGQEACDLASSLLRF